jgi:hypothetical protein
MVSQVAQRPEVVIGGPPCQDFSTCLPAVGESLNHLTAELRSSGGCADSMYLWITGLTKAFRHLIL